MTDPLGDAIDILASLDRAEAFAPIFDRHFDAVHGFVARRAGRDAADELAAEVFCIAFERRAAFDLRRDDARPWLFGIATRLLQRRLRSDIRRDRAVDRLRGLADADGSDLGMGIEGEQLAVALIAAIDALPADDRDTLLLFSWERLTYDQIAEALDVPIGTVRSRISRARSRIRTSLADAGLVGSGLTDSGHPTNTPEGQMT